MLEGALGVVRWVDEDALHVAAVEGQLRLQGVEVVAEDFHADLGADAGAEHEDAVFDRLEEAGDVAGDIRELLGEFGDEVASTGYRRVRASRWSPPTTRSSAT